MNQPYLSFLLLLGFVAFNAVLLIGLSHLLAPRKPTVLKDSPYESGMPPLGSAHERFSVKFYLVAMLFIIFDIETIFLFPWAVAFRRLGLFGLVEMVVFIGMVFVAYLYVWQKGGLDWEGPRRLSDVGTYPELGLVPLPAEYELGPGEEPVQPSPVGTAGRS